jgi:hypothetical protein
MDASENSPLDVIAWIMGGLCALCGLVFGFREGGIWGAIAGFVFGGIGGTIATYFGFVVLLFAIGIAALGTVVWIASHFF